MKIPLPLLRPRKYSSFTTNRCLVRLNSSPEEQGCRDSKLLPAQSHFQLSSPRRWYTVSANTLENKLSEWSARNPTPISIAEFLERGGNGKLDEEVSYVHLVQEVLVRLAHLIVELQHLPQELTEQENCRCVTRDYKQSFSELLEFEKVDPDPETLRKWSRLLKTWKQRHQDVVPMMARACMQMKNRYGMDLEREDCAITRTVQYCLDRLYMSRISLNMLCNQHLMVYGHASIVQNQVGVIHPETDVESVVRHAYDNALFLCEQCYLTGPALELRVANATEPGARVTVTQVPSHIYHIVFEIIKNAMQATVNLHLDNTEVLPPVKAFICQSDCDITIRVSDTGGGIDRNTTDRIFKYLYTTSPKTSLTCEHVPLSGLGYGLPLARLYARYFQGDLRAASYEGYGTDIYIYIRALAGEAVERLPVWSPTACSKMSARSSPIPDWTTKSSKLR